VQDEDWKTQADMNRADDIVVLVILFSNYVCRIIWNQDFLLKKYGTKIKFYSSNIM
jgi:hypothetical protein